MISCRHDGLRVQPRAARLRRRRGHLPTTARRWSSRPPTSSRRCRGGPRRGSSVQPRTTESPPPELIIQDELHLISGPARHARRPLRDRHRPPLHARRRPPKVVASTATIRRAQRPDAGPVRPRDAAVPAAGPRRRATRTSRSRRTADDEGHAPVRRADGARDQPDDADGPHLRRAAAERVASSTARDERPGPVLDAGRLLQQPARARRRAHAGPGRRRATGSSCSPRDGRRRATSSERIELTSREPSSRRSRATSSAWRSRYPDEDALDVILATNMISVGVDIDRLGLMVVMGQPQSTSEYIQATSRVGRRIPAWSSRCYNAARSRDRSHYEIVPCLPRGALPPGRVDERDAVLAARPRPGPARGPRRACPADRCRRCAENDGAATSTHHLDERSSMLREQILDARQQASTPDEVERDRDASSTRSSTPGSHARRRRAGARLRQPRASGQGAARRCAPRRQRPTGEHCPTLWSLRDVDRESNLYLVRL